MKSTKITLLSKAEPGDILFFGSGSSAPTFAGVYVGKGKMVIASQSKDEVVTRNVSELKGSFHWRESILSIEGSLEGGVDSNSSEISWNSICIRGQIWTNENNGLLFFYKNGIR